MDYLFEYDKQLYVSLADDSCRTESSFYKRYLLEITHKTPHGITMYSIRNTELHFSYTLPHHVCVLISRRIVFNKEAR